MKKLTLSNGIEILYLQNSSAKTVYLEAGFGVGLFSPEGKKQQIPHILEHLILRDFRSKNGEFRKNGKTNNLLTTFSFESTDKSFEKTLSHFISLFKNLNFSESDLQIQKNIVKNELLSLAASKNPAVYKEILKNQNIPVLTIQKEIETLKKIEKNDVLGFYKKFFTTKNLRILIIGNFDEKIITKAFENLNLPCGNPILAQNFKLKNAEISKSQQNLKFYTQIFTLNCSLSQIERITAEIILIEIQTRLHQKMRQNGLVYNLSVIFSEGSVLDNSIFAIESKINNENLAKFQEIIKTEISKIRQIDEEDFENAKRKLQNNLIFKMQTPAQIAQKQRIRFLTYGDFIDFETNLDKIKIKDFQKLAKKFFS
ncbi:MAG: insulinase family protein [bacterium]|nr:insulinase family protein [bacterium]